MLLFCSCASGKPLAIGTHPLIPTATPLLPGAQAAVGGTVASGDLSPAAGNSAGGGAPAGPAAAAPLPSAGLPDAVPAAASVNPTPVPPPAQAPTINPSLGQVAIPLAPDYQQRWRDQQVERQVLPAPRVYVAPAFQIVYWFDPAFGSYIPVGELRGEFLVQATFRIKGEPITSLEIPFNKADNAHNYGISVPDAIVARMKNVSKDGWAEVFIRKTSDIQPK